MTPHDPIAAFDVMAEAPDGVVRLRELVLEVAVRGKLVPQDTEDEPVSCLQEQLRVGRKRLIDVGAITEPRHPTGVVVEDEPYELPSSWKWVRLGDAGAIVGGGTPKSSEPAYWADGNDVPWLTPADMRHQSSRYVTRGRRDITRAGLASSGAQLLPAGSVLFSSRAPIGHVGIAAISLSTNQGFKSCVPYVPAMSEYLYLFLRKVGPEVDAAATGTTFKEVTGRDVAFIALPLPPLAEQHRIVTRVDELMGLLDRLEAARTSREATRAAVRDSALDALREAKTLDDVGVAWNRFAERLDDLLGDPTDIAPLRQAVLQLAVRGWLVAHGPTDEPASVLLERIARERARRVGDGTARPRKSPDATDGDDPRFTLPAGWEWCKLGDLLYQLGDGPHYSPKYVEAERGVPFLSTRNLSQTGFLLNDLKYVSHEDHAEFSKRVHAETGDVLYTKGGTTGIAVVNTLGFEFSVWVHVAVLKVAKEHLSPHYVALALNAPHCYEQSQALTHGTGNRDLGLTRMVSITVPLPPLAEQHRIVARVDELMGLLDRLEARLTAARTAHGAFAAAAVHHLDA